MNTKKTSIVALMAVLIISATIYVTSQEKTTDLDEAYKEVVVEVIDIKSKKHTFDPNGKNKRLYLEYEVFTKVVDSNDDKDFDYILSYEDTDIGTSQMYYIGATLTLIVDSENNVISVK